MQSPAALDAFVHGVAVRSWVLARHQVGDARGADGMLEAAVARFGELSAGLPLSQWPLAWWSALLADRGMLSPAQPAATDPLRRLPPGPRAALLLRLVAGLDLVHAAQALGVSQSAHDGALDQALRAPGLDPAGVEALRGRLHDEVQALARTQRSQAAATGGAGGESTGAATVAAQATAIAPGQVSTPGLLRHRDPDTDTEPAEAAPVLPLAAAPGWRERAAHQHTSVLVGLGILATAFAASLWWGPPAILAPGVREALPADSVAPAPPLDAAHAVTHPDYAEVAHPDEERLARDLAFLSWLAASTEPAPASAGGAPPAPPDAIPVGLRGLLAPAAAAWPTLDAAARARLLQQAADWNGRDAAGRAALLRALQDWDRLPATERARRREPMSGWLELGPSERAQVAAAARSFAARGIGEQTDLRLQFAALPDDAQHLWRLGPALGPELTAMAPLFAFLPEQDRPALLAALRTLDIDSRRNLALLAPRLSEAGRDELRRQLMRTPADQRAALIAARVATP